MLNEKLTCFSPVSLTLTFVKFNSTILLYKLIRFCVGGLSKSKVYILKVLALFIKITSIYSTIFYLPIVFPIHQCPPGQETHKIKINARTFDLVTHLVVQVSHMAQLLDFFGML